MTLSAVDQRLLEDLVARIRRVFGSGNPPAGADLVTTAHEAYTDSVDAFRASLDGRTWGELPQDWLREEWAGFCYFTPQGYRYYLPALLCGALRGLPEGDDLVHSVTFSLQPSMWEIYHRGADVQHEARVAALSRAEADVVCEFLGFIQRVRYPFLAAEALRWGWSQHDTPHHAGMHRHYARMFSYTWPRHPDASVAALIEQIERAFSGATCPPDDELCGSSHGDEPAGYALEFRGRDWRVLHPEFLNYNYPSLSFFAPAAFRYCYRLGHEAPMVGAEGACAASRSIWVRLRLWALC